MSVRPTRTPVGTGVRLSAPLPRFSSREIHPEGGQGILADDPAERHPEGHPLVLDEQDLEPVGAEHIEMLPDGHVGLHQDFDDLVDDHEDGAKDE